MILSHLNPELTRVPWRWIWDLQTPLSLSPSLLTIITCVFNWHIRMGGQPLLIDATGIWAFALKTLVTHSLFRLRWSTVRSLGMLVIHRTCIHLMWSQLQILPASVILSCGQARSPKSSASSLQYQPVRFHPILLSWLDDFLVRSLQTVSNWKVFHH